MKMAGKWMHFFTPLLTAARNAAPIGCWGLCIVTPPTTVNLKDAIISWLVPVVVDTAGVEIWLMFRQADPCKNIPPKSTSQTRLWTEWADSKPKKTASQKPCKEMQIFICSEKQSFIWSNNFFDFKSWMSGMSWMSEVICQSIPKRGQNQEVF